jgi:hypothetical protein
VSEVIMRQYTIRGELITVEADLERVAWLYGPSAGFNQKRVATRCEGAIRIFNEGPATNQESKGAHRARE